MFEAKVDKWINEAYLEGMYDFASLLRTLPGVYPTEAVAGLHRIDSTPTLRREWANSIIADAERDLPNGLVDPLWQVPVPHPLDYDWRFSRESAEFIAARAMAATQVGGTLILLGVPSILRILESQGKPGCNIVFVDRNRRGQAVSFEVKNLNCDLSVDPLPLCEASTIVTDPPWYPDYVRSFLWAASYMAREGARIFVVFPGAGTRPGIEAEWEETLEWAQNAGLQWVDMSTEKVEYITPAFERNALRASGILNVPNIWRRATLAEFRRTGILQAERPPRPETDAWNEVEVSGVRWRLRIENYHDNADPRLIELVPSGVLPSVSRRHLVRRLAKVWTSGNRIYGCNNTPLLREIIVTMKTCTVEQAEFQGRLKELSAGVSHVVPWHLIDEAAYQIQRVQEIETGEYGQ